MYNPLQYGGDMKLKVCILISAALVSLSASAARSGLEFTVNGKNYAFMPDCIKEINYTGKDEGESLSINFTDYCANRIRSISKENMGGMMDVSYLGNVLFSGPILTQISDGFRFSTERTSRVVLGRILNDYEVIDD